MEKKLKRQQIEVREHKKYFLHILYDNRVILLATLLPGFIWGWRQARVKGASAKMVKQIVKYGVLTALTNVKKQMLLK